jgi:His-Xaa-Ser system radical SAM maturase HxsB
MIPFKINNYRTRNFKDRSLLTIDNGSWALLTNKQSDEFEKGNIDKETFRILEKEGIIITKNNLNREVAKYQKRYHYLHSGATLHIIVPTLRCNQRCVYCHSSARPQDASCIDMDEETAKKTLEFIFQTPAKSITIEFQGGEPTLNHDILKYMVKEAKKINEKHKKDLSFSLVSNLSNIPEEKLDWFIEEGVDICTSLDGPKKVHDRNRLLDDGTGTYELTKRCIKTCKEKHKKKIGVIMVTTRHSLPYWKEIVDEYVEIGLDIIQLKYMSKIGFAKGNWEDIGYEPEEFIEFWKKSMEYILQLNKKGTRIIERYSQIILRKILTETDPNFTDLRTPCGLVTGQLAYYQKGDIYCCDEGRTDTLFLLGNVKTDNYQDVVSSENAQNLIRASMNNNPLCNACAYKPYCGTCIVNNYSREGSLIVNMSKNPQHKINQAMFDYIFNKIIESGEELKIMKEWI